MEQPQNMADVLAENADLRAQLTKRNAQLYDALCALASMWNQYCPPPRTHQSMSAGEEAEEVLTEWRLLLPDKSALYLDELSSGPEELPEQVRSLLSDI
ncbi:MULTISPECIES: hypothetical protein [Hymenobacter]|uniref:Uncharacterized protein n=1 Tax=Hymenobacter jejuensis TaxID=2502781 RepID=A0A5B8A4A5_9BACT|nr:MULTISPECIES: hypothetical protein [Hymenobacter]MBC6989526.1 hypothetical protein [Hymenobacter sp. BT491]QDA61546.1 hypothetical protein FHG12_16220 [Hymenobacter jejuensis]